MKLCMENKLSMFFGGSFTLIMNLPIQELWTALLLGVFGSLGGLIGRIIFNKSKNWIKKKWPNLK